MEYKILVADDSSNIQKVIKLVLEQEGHQVIQCEDYKTLDALLDEHRPDLLLLDFSMTDETDGYQVSKNLKLKFPHLFIILLFGTFETVDEDSISDAAIEGHLFKPFDGDKLVRICNTVLGISSDDATGVNVYEKAELTKSQIQIPKELNHDDSLPDVIDEDEIVESLNEPKSESKDESTGPKHLPEQVFTDTAHPNASSASDDGENDHEFANWGVAIPEEINSDDEQFPDQEDLDYPDAPDAGTSPSISSSPANIDSDKQTMDTITEPSSKLISVDDFNVPDEIMDEKSDNEDEDTDLISKNNSQTETHMRIKQQLEKEIPGDDIWAPDDEIEQADITGMHQLGPQLTPQDIIGNENFMDEVVSLLQEKIVSDYFESLQHQIRDTLEHKLHREIKKELLETLESKVIHDVKKEMEQLVEGVLQRESEKSINKEIWNVLPELAEKVIHQQLDELRRSIS